MPSFRRVRDRTGLVHPPALFLAWTQETASRFGGLTQLGADILGFWSEGGALVEDHSHWYGVAVKAEQVDALRAHVKEAVERFGQRRLYLQRSGEAELVWPGTE